MTVTILAVGPYRELSGVPFMHADTSVKFTYDGKTHILTFDWSYYDPRSIMQAAEDAIRTYVTTQVKEQRLYDSRKERETVRVPHTFEVPDV